MATGRIDAADLQAQTLNDAAQAMGGIVDLIGNITGQINMLALNDTIESARAGDDQQRQRVRFIDRRRRRGAKHRDRRSVGQHAARLG